MLRHYDELGLVKPAHVDSFTGYRYYSGLFTRWVYEHRRKGTKHEAEYSVNLLSPLFEEELLVVMPELRVSPEGEAEARGKLFELGVVGEYMVIHPGSHGSAAAGPAAADPVARIGRKT